MTEYANVEGEIRAILDRWAQAACVGDMEGVLAHHAEDILMFDVPAPTQCSGLDAYRRTWEIFFASNAPGPNRFRLCDVVIVADDDVAVAYGLLDVADGAARCRLTVAFRRGPESWQVIHEHHSMPLA